MARHVALVARHVALVARHVALVAPCSFALVQKLSQRDGDIRQDRPGLSPSVSPDDMLVFLEVAVFLQVQAVFNLPVPQNPILKDC